MIKLEWSNTCDLGNILYHTNWVQRMYIDSEIANSDYEVQQDGISDGEKDFNQTFGLFGKIYTFEFVATWYVADALTQLPLHSDIRIEEGSQLAIVKDIDVSVDPQDYYCVIKIDFTVERWVDIENNTRW